MGFLHLSMSDSFRKSHLKWAILISHSMKETLSHPLIHHRTNRSSLSTPPIALLKKILLLLPAQVPLTHARGRSTRVDTYIGFPCILLLLLFLLLLSSRFGQGSLGGESPRTSLSCDLSLLLSKKPTTYSYPFFCLLTLASSLLHPILLLL